VPSVPVYIQEKIHPRYIIEDIRKHAKKGQIQTQADLFGDFNGVKNFEEMIDFYQHDVHWSNRMILGDSLLVMNSLADKEGLKGKVQTIYMDPPYGIKFGSNWQVSTRKKNVADSKTTDVTRQPEQVKAFRDTWAYGVNSYLSYLRDRFVISRELLTESGSIFVQIGDQNVHLVRCILDEVFGSDNFISLISFATTGGFETATLSRLGDYILWYGKQKSNVKYKPLFLEKTLENLKSGDYRYLELTDGTRTSKTESVDDPTAKLFRYDTITSQGASVESQPYKCFGKKYEPKSGQHWKCKWPIGLERLYRANRIHHRESSLAYVRYFDDFQGIEISNMWGDTSIAGTKEGKWYVVQTNQKVIERCLLMTTEPGDLVLDPTCGSGTTAYVAEQWGRRWITMDTSRVALALARTRLMAAKYPYYLLSDSESGIRKEEEIFGKTPSMSLPKTEGDIRKGFVYKRVPHITPEIFKPNETVTHVNLV
jgi:adenine-specific DNA-methyltransferase